MALPKVTVNVQEETLLASNTQIPFVPAVLMKTKSGPIGTIETLTSEAQFKALFGDSDYTTPSAYAIQTYLRSYSYVLVTRLANEDEAKLGTGEMKATVNEDEEVVLISAKTDYKTDLYNGKEIKLVYNGTDHKLWLDVSAITGKNTISIKEDFTADTAKGDALETALNRLVASINAADLGFTLINKFTDKTGSDPIPAVDAFTTGFSLFITEGNSGNETPLETAKVQSYIDMYDLPDRDIDVMIIPEYTNYKVVNYATNLALKNNFEFLVAAQGTDASSAMTSVINYNTDNRGSLAIYFPDVYYNNFRNAEGKLQAIPSSIAVLHTYARTDIQNKWGAPAGVARGTLSLVTGLAVQLSDDMISKLYDNTIAINCINDISGKGFIVWGNKTASSDSAFFDRINVARLVKYVTKQAYNISWNYLFEPITNVVFTDWTLKVQAMLETIKINSGITEYQVIMDSTINTPQTIAANQLNGIIRIKPQEVAEFVNIDFIITDTIEVAVEA